MNGASGDIDHLTAASAAQALLKRVGADKKWIQVQSGLCGFYCVEFVLASRDPERASLGPLLPESIGAQGVSIGVLLDLCRHNGVEADAVWLELDEILGARTPVIMHLTTLHYVVFIRKIGESVLLYDPSCGASIVSQAELERNFSGATIVFGRLP